jgi:hypothetical protein
MAALDLRWNIIPNTIPMIAEITFRRLRVVIESEVDFRTIDIGDYGQGLPFTC